MKRILLSVPFLFIATLLSAQKFEISGSYSMAIPRGKMDDYINLTHSVSLQGIYRLPGIQQAWVGAQLGLGMYAHKKEWQTYQFRDGSTTETNVNFSNNVFNGHAVIGYDLLKDTKVVPYVTARAGISNFFTRIYIEDPHDFDGCRPLESRNVFSDATFSGGAGVGIRLDGKKFFKSPDKNWAIDLSVNYLAGGTLDYINVRHLQNNTPQPDDPKKEFMVKFINVSTNEIHEHKVAEVYTSKLKQIDIRVGFTYRL